MVKKNKNKDKDRLPFHIVRDKQHQLRVKLKETLSGVTNRYGRMPRRLWSSLAIVLAIFIIVLTALFSGIGRSPSLPEESIGELAANPGSVMVDQENQIQALVPEKVGLELNMDEFNPAEEDSTEALARTPLGSQTTLEVERELNQGETLVPKTFSGIYPLRRQGAIITDFGWYFHPILEVWRYHQGLDIRCKEGDIVMAVADGEVLDIKESYYEVLLVTIEHADGWQSVYGQLEQVPWQVGDWVKAGQKLGSIGMSETAVESHLHFGIQQGEEFFNPLEVMAVLK